MRNYNQNEVVRKLNSIGGVTVSGNKITIEAALGIKRWGMVDYLKNHCGYSVIVK